MREQIKCSSSLLQKNSLLFRLQTFCNYIDIINYHSHTGGQDRNAQCQNRCVVGLCCIGYSVGICMIKKCLDDVPTVVSHSLQDVHKLQCGDWYDTVQCQDGCGIGLRYKGYSVKIGRIYAQVDPASHNQDSSVKCA